MASMSRNASSNSLMGFSVHQPAIGAPLQFFPAMGSKQLDDMINAYVPGSDSILDKRAAVSMEFFEHTLATGELFKFFMVYPYLATAVESPTSSSVMQDSGYGSSFNTSPIMSEGQKARTSSAKKAAATTADFSHIPGMKIMTKDGRDVTNSASRACKTKEQRDHAHLMRIIKACEACRKKKIRCDPSHKRRVGGPSEAKVTKKAKVARPAAAPSQKASEEASPASSFDSVMPGSISEIDSFFPQSDTTDSVPMEWDQFIQYDEELAEPVVPYDYDFFFDPAGYFSPANSATNTSSTSPYQPITPVLPTTSATEFNPAIADTVEESQAQAPTLPYLNPGGLEAGNNYVDFNLYSPGSSWSLDDDPSLAKEVAASPGLEHSGNFSSRQPQPDCHIRRLHRPDQDVSSYETGLQAVDRNFSPRDEVISTMIDYHSYFDRSDHRPSLSPYDVSGDTSPEGFRSPSLLDLGHFSGGGSAPQAVLSSSHSGLNSGSIRYSLSTSRAELSDPLSSTRHGGDLGSGQSPASAIPNFSSSRASVDQQDRDKVQSRYDAQNSAQTISGDGYSSSHIESISDRALERIPHTVSSSNEAQGGLIPSSSTRSGSSPRPPLPSPDRPPVMSNIPRSKPEFQELLVSENKSTPTRAYAALGTMRSTESSSSPTPEHAVATTAGSREGFLEGSRRKPQAPVLQLTKSVSPSNSVRSGVAMMAVESIFEHGATANDCQSSPSADKSLIQRKPDSSLSSIVAAAGLCGFLYVLSNALNVTTKGQLGGGAIGALSVFVVVAYIKLLQHPALCADKLNVPVQPLSLTRQPWVAITDSVKRRYLSLQSRVSVPIRRGIAMQSSPSRSSLFHYELRTGVLV